MLNETIRRYWRVEKRLSQQIQSTNPQLVRSDVEFAAQNKTNDMRILFFVVDSLLGPHARVSKEVHEWLFKEFTLIDLLDDLFDYEKDLAAKSHNTFIEFEMMYGKRKGLLEYRAFCNRVHEGQAARYKTLRPIFQAKYEQSCLEYSRLPSTWATLVAQLNLMEQRLVETEATVPC